ncbi:MAG: hypothetical protein J0H01_19450 [Rhizobiales bacterium]|nr:hypothetical protein [Hyphomicrobiales bacterium]
MRPAFVMAALLLVLLLVGSIRAIRKDVQQGFDELAHASYVAQMQHSHALWLDLDSLRMLDPKTLLPTAEPNYLNHPPFYYRVLAWLGPAIEGHPEALLVHRLINLAVVALGFAALLLIPPATRWSQRDFAAYAVPLLFMPVLAPLAGSINNDNFAFTGGALALLAAFRLLAGGGKAWLWLLLAAFVLASWSKLSGLLLVGGFVILTSAWMAWRRQLSPGALLLIALATLVAVAPYLVLIQLYGSAAPYTAALQATLLADSARAGWADAPRLSLPAYGLHFAADFLRFWMPALNDRNLFQYAMLVLPFTALICAGAGLLVSLGRIVARREEASDVVVVAGAAALAVTFVLHLLVSYQRHVATGWLMDAYPRYYLPLAAIVPLACLALASAAPPRWRKPVLGFFIIQPILFQVFGAAL